MAAPVKWFHNGMVGAPVMNGTAGTQIAVLDACLVKDSTSSRCRA
jgi:hypothetical protein